MSYYQIMLDGKSMYDPSYKEMSFTSASVVIAVGQAGSFDFTMPRNHLFNDSIVPYGSTIEVFEDEQSIFYGRPLPPNIDLLGQKSIHCEGALAFLNDVICPPNAPRLFVEMDDGEYYKFIFDYYNSQQSREDRKIYLGTVPTGGDKRKREWSNRPCIDELRSNVLPYTGGTLVTRRYQGRTYIDWKDTFIDASNQPVEIGLNLLDVSRTGKTFYTCAIAKGGQDSNGNNVAMTYPVRLSNAVRAKYGDICASLDYPEATSLTELQAKCNTFLTQQQFDSFTFEASALDLHVQNEAYERFDIGRVIRIKFSEIDSVVSVPITTVNVDINSGKKVVTASMENWKEKKKYLKNQFGFDFGSISAIQSDLYNFVLDLFHDSISLDGIGSFNFDSITLTDPDTGLLQEISLSTVDGIPELSIVTPVPVDMIIRRIDDVWTAGVTIYGDLIRTTPEGDITELSEYTILSTDTIEIWHENDVIDTYIGVDEFKIYYGDKFVIYTVEGDTITKRTYDLDFSYDIGDQFDPDDYDGFYEWGNGTESLIDSNDLNFNIEDGFEFTGTEIDPTAITASVNSNINANTTKLKIDPNGITASTISGAVPISGMEASLPINVNGSDVEPTRIAFTKFIKTYVVGKQLHYSYYKVTAYYPDNTTADITNDCEFSVEDEYTFTGTDDPKNLVASWTYSATGKMFVTQIPLLVVATPEGVQTEVKNITTIEETVYVALLYLGGEWAEHLPEILEYVETTEMHYPELSHAIERFNDNACQLWVVGEKNYIQAEERWRYMVHFGVSIFVDINVGDPIPKTSRRLYWSNGSYKYKTVTCDSATLCGPDYSWYDPQYKDRAFYFGSCNLIPEEEEEETDG